MPARALVLILLLSGLSAGPASAQQIPDGPCEDTGRPPGTTFKAQTDGFPVVTEVGGWQAEKASAYLCFRGGHVLGSATTVAASWRSPFTRREPHPRLYVFAHFPGITPLADVEFELGERSQIKDRPWTRWDVRTYRHPPDAFGTYYELDSTLYPLKPVRARFEWSLTMTITSPAAIHGDVWLAVS